MNSPVASFWGTPDYASLSALKRLPQTPRDDLEALVYCLVEMEQPDGRLPWHGCLTNDREAAAGWSHARLSEMASVKRAYWNAACKEVRGRCTQLWSAPAGPQRCMHRVRLASRPDDGPAR